MEGGRGREKENVASPLITFAGQIRQDRRLDWSLRRALRHQVGGREGAMERDGKW